MRSVLAVRAGTLAGPSSAWSAPAGQAVGAGSDPDGGVACRVGVQIEQDRYVPGQTSRVCGQPLVAVEHVVLDVASDVNTPDGA